MIFPRRCSRVCKRRFNCLNQRWWSLICLFRKSFKLEDLESFKIVIAKIQEIFLHVLVMCLCLSNHQSLNEKPEDCTSSTKPLLAVIKALLHYPWNSMKITATLFSQQQFHVRDILHVKHQVSQTRIKDVEVSIQTEEIL